jgi:2,5-diamino-6-(ribosylamino)-4(3H)-pyrimidinone 5'-phosphate reductase
VYTDLSFPLSLLEQEKPGGARRPYTIINAVGTLDGRGAVDGRSTPIGSAVDHRLMRNIRACMDAVLVGAGTLRSENLSLTVDDTLAKRRKALGLREQPLSVILTRCGDIPTDRRIFHTSKENVLVFAGAEDGLENAAKLSDLATVQVLASKGFLEPEKVLETLAKEFGVRRLLVEGGPRVNRSFVEGRLVDEVFLTLAPKIIGGDSRSLIEGAPLPTLERGAPSLISIHLSNSELYLRYRMQGPDYRT